MLALILLQNVNGSDLLVTPYFSKGDRNSWLWQILKVSQFENILRNREKFKLLLI